jgi:hypothetical protein
MWGAAIVDWSTAGTGPRRGRGCGPSGWAETRCRHEREASKSAEKSTLPLQEDDPIVPPNGNESCPNREASVVVDDGDG